MVDFDSLNIQFKFSGASYSGKNRRCIDVRENFNPHPKLYWTKKLYKTIASFLPLEYTNVVVVLGQLLGH